MRHLYHFPLSAPRQQGIIGGRGLGIVLLYSFQTPSLIHQVLLLIVIGAYDPLPCVPTFRLM
jgi:hypothetical protein